MQPINRPSLDKSIKRRILRAIDHYLGAFLVILLFIHRTILRRDKRRVDRNQFNRILIVKLVGLGDMVLLLTVLSKIKDAMPRAEIHILTTPGNSMIFKNNCLLVDNVIEKDIFRSKNYFLELVSLVRDLCKFDYDLAIDFEQHFNLTPIILYLANIPLRCGFYYYHIRSLLFTHAMRISSDRHMLLDFLGLARILITIPEAIPKELVSPVIQSINRTNAANWLRRKGLAGKKRIVLHPGCGPSGLCRAWPKERFAHLAVKLAQKGYVILLSGTPIEHSIIDFILSKSDGAEVHSLVGELDFPDYIALLDDSDLLIVNDTGPMHLGAALRVPTLGLFGPENPERYKPYGPGNFYLYVKQSCSPCNHNYRGIRPNCKNAIYQKCMLEISVDMVEREVMEII
jgi:heptosyltransferase-2